MTPAEVLPSQVMSELSPGQKVFVNWYVFGTIDVKAMRPTQAVRFQLARSVFRSLFGFEVGGGERGQSAKLIVKRAKHALPTLPLKLPLKLVSSSINSLNLGTGESTFSAYLGECTMARILPTRRYDKLSQYVQK